MKYYKRDPDAALAGMMELTLEECGAYNRIIDMLYSRDGRLPDDDSMIRTALHCHWHTWRSVKQRLIRKGKIWLEHGFIKAKRVDETIEEATAVSEKQRAKVAKRWCNGAKAATKTLKNSPDSDAIAARYSTNTPPSIEEVSDKNLNKNKQAALPLNIYESDKTLNKGLTSFVSSPRREKKRLPRQPMREDWRPTDNGLIYARSLGFAEPRIEDEIRGCVNWHLKNGVLIAGEVGLAATWRNWCDKALKIDNERRFHQTGARYARRMEKPELAERIREYADEARQYERQAGIVRSPDAV